MGEHDDLENAGSDHDLLIIVAHDVRRVIKKVGEQNGRITLLEKWQQRVIYTLAGALLISPLAIFEVRQWLAQILAGG